MEVSFKIWLPNMVMYHWISIKSSLYSNIHTPNEWYGNYILMASSHIHLMAISLYDKQFLIWSYHIYNIYRKCSGKTFIDAVQVCRLFWNSVKCDIFQNLDMGTLPNCISCICTGFDVSSPCSVNTPHNQAVIFFHSSLLRGSVQCNVHHQSNVQGDLLMASYGQGVFYVDIHQADHEQL